jgi:hypothetical protein
MNAVEYGRITLPIELTNGNDGRGNDWMVSNSRRKQYEKLIRQLGLVRSPFEFPVIIYVVRILGPKQRLWDSSSVGRGNWKEIEDSLVACGWFKDDSTKHIVNTFFYQDETRRDEGPCVEIIVETDQTNGTGYRPNNRIYGKE